MSNKKQYKKNRERTLSILMACSLVIPAANLSLLASHQPNATQQALDMKDLTTLSDKELAVLANPIVQSYKADEQNLVWQIQEGTRFVIQANQANLENERLVEVVKLVNAEFVEKELVTSPLAMVYANADDINVNDVIINIDKDIMKNVTDSDEAYQITINDKGVHVTGASENAIMYALRTIQNYMITAEGLVSGMIQDYPDMAERRIHVDLARKYISKDWFIREIREMSYLKMNALQMHFSENLGFRIECETDPAIVSDEYLTKAEVREILAEAKKYGIKVIPSFDSPGHVDQILKAHPEYGQISNKGTHFASGLDITNPEAVAYIRTLYSEYMDLFEGCTDFHIGGDEYMEFDRNPFRSDYQSVLDAYAKENIAPNAIWKDTVANYINELAEFVYERGFKPRVWNDGLYYGEKSSSEKPQMIKMHDYIGVDFWSQMTWNRDIANLETIVSKGHKVIYNFNASFFYYVLRNDKPTDGREQHSFDYLNQDKRIFEEWSPGKFQSNTVSDDSDFIKGASLGVWCDNPKLVEEDVIMEDIADELRSLATKSWNIDSSSLTNFSDFQKNYTQLGNVAGFEKGSQLPEVPDIVPAESLGKVTIRFVSDTGVEIKKDKIHYGTIGDAYQFHAEDIYGYRLVSEGEISGSYTADGAVYTFAYEAYCDKSALEKEVLNPIYVQDYINETVFDYKEQLVIAKGVLMNEESMQWDVDEAYQNLMNVKHKTVKLKDYPLYVETAYPLSDIGYSSGYSAYLKIVEESKAVLYQENATAENLKNAYDAIVDAKAKLMLPDGIKVNVNATSAYYVDRNLGEAHYNYDKMLDGNAATKCWFGEEQEEGHEIVFSFPKKLKMTEVRIVQPKDVKDDAIAAADVEVAEVLGEWQKVGEFTQNELNYTAKFEERAVQYVRIKLTKSKSPYWYQIQDVFFTYEQPKEDNTLRDMIVEAEILNLDGKPSQQISAFVDVLIEAQKAFVKQDSNMKEHETLLRNAIDAVIQEDHKQALQILYETCARIKNLGYTQASWSAFQTALSHAKEVLENVNAQPEEIAEAYDGLETAMKELQEDVTLVRSILKSAIDKVEKADISYLAPDVVALIKTSLSDAKAVYDNPLSTSQEYLNVWFRLANAMHYLDFKADKRDLETLIQECKKLNLDEYTSGVEEFTAALSNAESVLADDGVLQESINNAYKRLENARNGLMKEDVNKALLLHLYNTILEAIGDGSAYAKDNEAWTNFSNAMNNASALLIDEKATQADINNAFQLLASAYEDIRLLPDEALLSELKSFIHTLRNVDLTRFSAPQINLINNTKARAMQMLNDPSSITEKNKSDILRDMACVLEMLKEMPTEIKKPSENVTSAKPENVQITSKAQNVTVSTKGTTKTGDSTKVALPMTAGFISFASLCLLRKRRK